MSFKLYPAVDIRGGKCVRLIQGDYKKEVTYFESPVEAALKWHEAGSSWLHVIDLDGAKSGQPENLPIIKEILKHIDINIQVGGGIRNKDQAAAYLKNGVTRIIIGSAALTEPDLVKELLEEFGDERIIVSLDGRKEKAFSHGWLDESEITLLDAAQKLTNIGIRKFIYTDIEKDGTLSGPNITQALTLAAKTGKEIIVAGGISSNKDILELTRYQNLGIKGAIIGRALYTGDICLKSLLSQLKEV